MQTGTYLIKHADRFLGLRHQKQTFINLHDSTSIFRLVKESEFYYLKSKDDQFITPGPDMEIALQPRMNSAAALTLEDSDTSGQFYLKTSSGTYIKGSRYELRQSEDKTGDCKLGFLDLNSVRDDNPEWMVWAGQNPEELTPPDEIIKAQGFQHKAPTAGVFNWLLNNISKSLNYLNIKRLQQRQDHEQLDDYVRRRVLDIDEDLGDAIRAAETAQSASELARADAETARDGAGSSEAAAREYAASALSSKNSASASQVSAAASASSSAGDAIRAESAKESTRRDAETASIKKNEAVRAAEASKADAETARNSATGAESSKRVAVHSAEQAREAKTAAASSEHAANNHKNTAISYSESAFNYYTKSHASANTAKHSEMGSARSAIAAASSAEVSSGSAREAKTHADAARQDYTNLSNSLNAHKIDAKNKFDRIEMINHQQGSGSFNLTRETINSSGPWVRDLTGTGGTCFIRFWIKITEYHNESSGWIERKTYGAEFLLVSNPYPDDPWDSGATKTFGVHAAYGIRNVFDQMVIFGLDISSTHIQIKGHQTQEGRIEQDVRQNKKRFGISWHTLG